MRRASLLVLALAACRHVPPDKEARAVKEPEPMVFFPEQAELVGSWRSIVLRGSLAELGHTVVYVFGEDGTYTGAVISEKECTPIGGTWEYLSSTLSLDGGALAFEARLLGDKRLVLESAECYVELLAIDDRIPERRNLQAKKAK